MPTGDLGHWRYFAEISGFARSRPTLVLSNRTILTLSCRHPEMRVMRDGIGLTWPNEVDFSADALRQDAEPPPENRTGADLIAALQASPHRDIEIEPERCR
jgi:hypothetical protein